MSTFVKDLRDGLAQYIAANDDTFTWSPTGDFTADQIALTIVTLVQSPDRMVAISASHMKSDPALADSMFNIQFLARGRAYDSATGTGGPDEPVGLCDAIDDLLLGNFPLILPTGVELSTLIQVGGGDGGQDENQRWLYATRYQSIAHRPSPHRQ